MSLPSSPGANMTTVAASTGTGAESPPPTLGRRLQHGWLELAGHFGEVQSVLIVCFVYVFVMGPMAVIIALTRRDLLAKRGYEGPASAWLDADSVSQPDIERAKRLF